MSTYTLPIKNTSTINVGIGATSITGAYSSTSWPTSITEIKNGQLQVKGDAVFDGKITWQGRDMREWYNVVESRLNILQPNLELEAKWEELAQLRQQYIALEQELLEKQRVVDILKNY